MTMYTVRTYTYQLEEIHAKRIECDRRDVPHKLAGIAADYLGSNPHHTIMQALVSTGRNDTQYLIRLQNGTVSVYRHVFQCNMEEVNE